MGMIMRVLGIAALTVLAGCATYEPTPIAMEQGRSALPPPSMEVAGQAVAEYFKQSLYDPYSAQYEFTAPVNSYLVQWGEPHHGWFMCGTVNAKNRMGGYVGAQNFWAFFNPINPTQVIAGATDSSESMQGTWRCQDIAAHRQPVAWTPAE